MIALCEIGTKQSFSKKRIFGLVIIFALCELNVMTDKPSTSEVASLAGISAGYASDMLNGKRPLPRALALHIFQKTGWKHDSVSNLTDQQIAVLETVEVWVAPKRRSVVHDGSNTAAQHTPSSGKASAESPSVERAA